MSEPNCSLLLLRAFQPSTRGAEALLVLQPARVGQRVLEQDQLTASAESTARGC